MNNSRTVNVIKNMSVGLIGQFLSLILSFVSRTIFIKYLSADYLGLNGIFTNILSILSFAEMGIGSAIVFALYKPLAENNIPLIQSIMAFYEKIYRIIGFVVFSLGLVITPFLNLIIKEKPQINENLTVIYFLFLLTQLSQLKIGKYTLI